MEKAIKLGTVGSIDLKFAGGNASISIVANDSVLGGAVSLASTTTATISGAELIDLLFKEIESKSPAGAIPIEETVKDLIKSAVAAIV